MIDHSNTPVPTATESPDSHQWFRSRLEEFTRRCDGTVAAILKQEAAADLAAEFSLPSTDDLIGLPPTQRGTNAYSQATKKLKEKLTKEVHLMEAAVEKGFRSLATAEKALAKSRREVRDLRSVLIQLPSGNSAAAQQGAGGEGTQQSDASSAMHVQTSVVAGPSLSGSFSSFGSAFPADIAVSLAEEQNEIKQLRATMQNLQAQLSSTKKELGRERAAFKDTCDVAVRCNTVDGPQSLRM